MYVSLLINKLEPASAGTIGGCMSRGTGGTAPPTRVRPSIRFLDPPGPPSYQFCTRLLIFQQIYYYLGLG